MLNHPIFTAIKGNLNQDQMKSLKQYQGSDSKRINDYLRSGRHPAAMFILAGGGDWATQKFIDHAELTVNMLDEVMIPAPCDMIIYRGTSVPSIEVNRGWWVERGYMSSSECSNVASGFGGGGGHANNGWTSVLMEIHLPAGHPLVPIMEITGAYTNEKERVLARNTKLTVITEEQLVQAQAAAPALPEGVIPWPKDIHPDLAALLGTPAVYKPKPKHVAKVQPTLKVRAEWLGLD